MRDDFHWKMKAPYRYELFSTFLTKGSCPSDGESTIIFKKKKNKITITNKWDY